MPDFDDTVIDEVVASLGADTDRLPLPPPVQLRAIGDARTRRNVVAMASLVVVIVAMLAGAGLALANPRALPQAPASVGPPDVGPVTPTTPTPPPTTQPPTTTAGPVAGAPCTAVGIEYVSTFTGFAMGSAVTTYTVRNVGPVSCTLTGSPALRYLVAGGGDAEVPAGHAQGGPLLVQAGAQADFAIETVNGYGGYQSDSPACAHPATYDHVSVVLSDGSTVPLGADGRISLQCGSVQVGVWNQSGN
jgi:hypothetical protein